ncbi:MAG TPA: hypothetical protein VFA54_16900 [Bryobacterales bacterium]|jgi:hypothetical protein|nr:hypothetical protein [Bryobacterales bacterium]
MSTHIFRQIRGALQNLNPREVQQMADQPFTIGLLAEDEPGYHRMVQFLLPTGISEEKLRQASAHLLRIQTAADFEQCDLGLAEPHLEHPGRSFYGFDAAHPTAAVERCLEEREDLWIPLARHFLPFRGPVIERLIRKISRENALFALASALPNIVPSFIELPWAVGEFASDIAVLTMNQIRMAFLIAAASDAPVGFIDQRGQIASIITSAFGWRAIARELVSKVPFGCGLIPKGAIAFAGTYVVGLGLERYLRLGSGFTAQEKREEYQEALDRGRMVVRQIVGS